MSVTKRILVFVKREFSVLVGLSRKTLSHLPGAREAGQTILIELLKELLRKPVIWMITSILLFFNISCPNERRPVPPLPVVSPTTQPAVAETT